MVVFNYDIMIKKNSFLKIKPIFINEKCWPDIQNTKLKIAC
jgi:hypothetical protein